MSSKPWRFMFAIVILVAVAALLWWSHYKATERGYLEGLLNSRMAEVSYVAYSLKLLDEGDVDRHRALLEWELTSSTQDAARMVGTGARLHAVALPNFADGLRRARSYAVAHGIKDVVRDIDLVLASLPPPSRSGT